MKQQLLDSKGSPSDVHYSIDPKNNAELKIDNSCSLSIKIVL
jgi:hypothetical protein